ncbi:hypothetical protein D6M20_01825 (plasmid) [Rhodococcus qingshengii]|jgi:hypothetical protein|uniref:hypothetical protein n=1 Tax=Rhodococcus qingshengii TaxID=334542 RepID=UPI0011EE830F|nr:hypothetical protein [Rhodococcus qingshengii]QEM25585.1 hypothetical protein D6M20_01825 [Rhodococcus qingshengii]
MGSVVALIVEGALLGWVTLRLLSTKNESEPEGIVDLAMTSGGHQPSAPPHPLSFAAATAETDHSACNTTNPARAHER